jgi:hypothetical protein
MRSELFIALASFLLHHYAVVEPAGLILAGRMPAVVAISTPLKRCKNELSKTSGSLAHDQWEFTRGQRLVTS